MEAKSKLLEETMLDNDKSKKEIKEKDEFIRSMDREQKAMVSQILKLEEDLEISVSAKEDWIKTMYKLKEGENECFKKYTEYRTYNEKLCNEVSLLKNKLTNAEKDLEKERNIRSEMIGHNNPNNKVKLLEK